MDLTGIRAIVIELHERVTGPEGPRAVRQSLTARAIRLAFCARMDKTVPPSEITVEGGKEYSHGRAG
jgi:hypothetical protein